MAVAFCSCRDAQKVCVQTPAVGASDVVWTTMTAGDYGRVFDGWQLNWGVTDDPQSHRRNPDRRLHKRWTGAVRWETKSTGGYRS